ncbi:hypothetical protein AB6A40_005068 [Gnathostoma spinigerum]|uniref:Methylmalonic aciduria and homocystinuria type D protein n=1 Tax=Gnathostoma spinigerum TaxID=75299 RepID=A0ABD6EEC9_9BILA
MMALRSGTNKMNVYCANMRMLTARMQAFSTQTQQGTTVVVFLNKEPSNQNKLLGPDKRFPLPGDVSSQASYSMEMSKKSEMVEPKVAAPSMTVNELLEKSVNDIKRAPVTGGNSFAEKNVEMKAVECPKLLKKDLRELFPGMDFTNQEISVLNVTQKSNNDMSAWSIDMEVERMQLTAAFIESATAICNVLSRFGYWADFIDPSSGRPYLGKFTNATLFETDDRYRSLGFEIEDAGCCKILKHVMWGANAFVGTIFTNAPIKSSAIEAILAKVNTE